MNNNQGLTAGAVVLTGLTGFLLRPLAMSPGSSAAMVGQAASARSATLTGEVQGEGPWIASCDYWAAVRPLRGDDAKRVNVSMQMTVDGSTYNSTTTAAATDAASCPGASGRWGIPDPLPASQNKAKSPPAKANPARPDEPPDTTPRITAIIATVPDPAREHLALDFDHTVDGLLQAANDNGYLESYSWLPWKDPGESSQTIQLTTTGQEQMQEKERERKRLKEPGLIVLKYFDRTLPKEERHEIYNRVLYLFLVGNTPMEGIEGDQLANALRYERELQDTAGVCFRGSVSKDLRDCNPSLPSDALKPGYPQPSSAGPSQAPDRFQPSAHALAVIGPNFTGAASSLRAQLDKVPIGMVPVTPQKKPAQPGPSAQNFPSGLDRIDVFADVGTQAGISALQPGKSSLQPGQSAPESDKIHLVSFAGNQAFETDSLKQRTCSDKVRTAVLIEDNTAYGASVTQASTNPETDKARPPTSEQSKQAACPEWQIFKYPRGIALLRNAREEEQSHLGQSNAEAPSPYLHMSLGDKSEKGTIPQFSPQTASSQEAQLVAITQQLQRGRAQLIVLNGSNALDTLFLARFFHRTLPDARLLVFGADLLVLRDTDNRPLVGAVSIDAYPLVAPMPSELQGGPRRAFESTITESVYNAASFALWDKSEIPPLHLANYRNFFEAEDGVLYPSLWAMAVGRDAFYPLGVFRVCGSDKDVILPLLGKGSKNPENCSERESGSEADGHSNSGQDFLRLFFMAGSSDSPASATKVRFPFDPSPWWYYLCGAVCLGCILHIGCVHFASFSSLTTRDLAIDEMNNPSRRAVFIHIGTVMLFAMAIVVGFPVFPMLQVGQPNLPAEWFGRITVILGIWALVLSFTKAIPYVRRKDVPRCKEFPFRRTHVYLMVHAIAFAAMVAIPVIWFLACEDQKNHVGLFFCYRCVYPFSGVSPLLPVLLLLIGWYMWSILQTRRMRFSERTRPQVPGRLEHAGFGFYVSEDELQEGTRKTDLPLYGNMTCLFITPYLICRLSNGKLPLWFSWALLVLFYVCIMLICLFGIQPQGMERLLNDGGRILFQRVTEYEWLVGMLFFPLLLIALTGLLRMVIIWATLRRQLLRRLEFYPLRFAFGRMSTVGWMSMLRQSDDLERRREWMRSLESMRQLAHHEGISELIGENRSAQLKNSYNRVLIHLDNLRHAIEGGKDPIGVIDDEQEKAATDAFHQGQDFPRHPFDVKARMSYFVENDFAVFGRELLEFVLIPYWKTQREEMVESEEHETTHAHRLVPGKTEGMEYAIHAGLIKEPPLHICLAEEFVAIRYVSLIRAVLVNIRHLITFVSFAWVLSMIAWNSYPFRPRETVDVIFTVLFLILGAGVVWVFSQMYRDVLLSRITRTQGNELGSEFYIRIAMVGGIPLITWLAYQFPAVGAVVLKYLQPGMEALK